MLKEKETYLYISVKIKIRNDLVDKGTWSSTIDSVGCCAAQSWTSPDPINKNTTIAIMWIVAQMKKTIRQLFGSYINKHIIQL